MYTLKISICLWEQIFVHKIHSRHISIRISTKVLDLLKSEKCLTWLKSEGGIRKHYQEYHLKIKLVENCLIQGLKVAGFEFNKSTTYHSYSI